MTQALDIQTPTQVDAASDYRNRGNWSAHTLSPYHHELSLQCSSFEKNEQGSTETAIHPPVCLSDGGHTQLIFEITGG